MHDWGAQLFERILKALELQTWRPMKGLQVSSASGKAPKSPPGMRKAPFTAANLMRLVKADPSEDHPPIHIHSLMIVSGLAVFANYPS